MEKKSIEDLIGNKIIRFKKVHDYWQLFTDKATLNIYTNYKLTTIKNATDQNHKAIISDPKFEGATITKAYITDQHFCLELDKKDIFEISILEKDYVGPEAVELIFESGTIIVF